MGGSKARTLARRVVNRLGVRRPSGRQRPWSQVVDPQPPDPLSSFRFFAVIGAWMEGDVIAATVKNALLHGCERVYLVDNDSPDDTVAAAEAAGAVLARSYATESYDENLRLRL